MAIIPGLVIGILRKRFVLYWAIMFAAASNNVQFSQILYVSHNHSALLFVNLPFKNPEECASAVLCFKQTVKLMFNLSCGLKYYYIV